MTLLDKQTANGSIITSLVPADFDGDNQMDILVTRKKPDVSYLIVQIYWGKKNQMKLGKCTLSMFVISN